jgi:TPR repeat protein
VKKPLVALAIFWLLLVLVSGASAESLQATMAKAKKGDAAAQWRLGMRYARGDGVKQSWAQARAWMEKAAAQGNLQAIGDLGVMYLRGYGVKQDYDRARALLEKSANGGHPTAQLLLGDLYADGRGVKQDYVQAKAWYEKAVAQGETEAMVALGVMYERDDWVEKDLARAREMYQKAAERGNIEGMVDLGLMYERGEGGGKDLAKAREWYQKAADRGNKEAGKLLKELEIAEGPAEGGKVVQANAGKEGQAIDLKSLAVPGRRVLVFCYSPLHPPDRELVPRLERFAAKSDWLVMLVNVDRPGVEETDWDSPLAEQLQVATKPYPVLPHPVLLDRQGQTAAEGGRALRIIEWQMKRAGVE